MSTSLERIEFYRHHLGDAEIAAVAETMKSVFLTTGPKTKQFEDEFARYLDLPHVVTVNSCTAAISLSLEALGVKPGDEVITTPMTFIATSTAILHIGAIPVFVDVDPLTGNIDPKRIGDAITTRTRAIVPVHLYGHLCDMAQLREIADRHKLWIVEDAAHCVEGRDPHGFGPGHFGDAACFSFYATKNLCCGEGGAIATRHTDLVEKLLLLRLHGMNRDAANRYHDATYKHWDMTVLGQKANLSDIQSAMLLPQLPRLKSLLARRESIAQRFEKVFSQLPGIAFPSVKPGHQSARHLFTLWIKNGHRDHFLRDMGEMNLGVAVNYRAIHLLTYFRERFGFRTGSFPHAEQIGDETASIPFYPGLTDDHVSHIVDRVSRWAERVAK